MALGTPGAAGDSATRMGLGLRASSPSMYLAGDQTLSLSPHLSPQLPPSAMVLAYRMPLLPGGARHGSAPGFCLQRCLPTTWPHASLPPWALQSPPHLLLGGPSHAASVPGQPPSPARGLGRGFLAALGGAARQGQVLRVWASHPQWAGCGGEVEEVESEAGGLAAWAGSGGAAAVQLPALSVGRTRAQAVAGMSGAGGAFASPREVLLERPCWLDGGCERARRGYLYRQLCCVGGCGGVAGDTEGATVALT